MKKLLALFLAISMTFSLIIMPVSAADKLTVSLDQAEVEAGKEVKVNLNVSNNPGLTALTVRVFYKKDELTCTGISTQKQSDNNFTAWKQFEKELATLEEEEEQGRKVSVEFNKNDTSAANLSEERKNAGWALANFAYIVSKTVFDKNGVVACLTFKAAEGLESGTTPIEIEIVKASGEKNVTLETASLNSSLTINGVAPTLGKVTLSSTPVQVDGTTGATVNATATSTSNKDITALVTWSISGGENSGVSINAATGEITVGAKAKAGGYTVTATAIDGKTQGAAKIATLTVTRALSGYKITVTPLSKAMIIPTSEEITQQFTATAVDRYDDEVTSGFTWSLNPSDIEGVSIAKDGTVTVTAGAKDAISDRQEFSVIATLDNSPGKPYGQAILVVKRDSDRVPSSVVISGGPEGSTLAVPMTDIAATATYTATVKDQYGAEITKPGTITWELTNDAAGSTVVTRAGVSIENGVLTVTNAAAGNDFIASSDPAKQNTLLRPIYIKATCGNVSSRVDTIILIRQPAEVTRIVIEGIHSAALCKVPTMDDNENFEHALTVKKIDQYGVTTEAAANEVTWDKLSVLGVTLQNGTLTIQPDAAGNDFTTDKYGNLVYSFDIKATCGTVSDTKTITLKREPSVATAIAYGTGMTNPVVPTNETPVSANVTLAVEDQYGVPMNSATVEPDGDLPVGFIWQEGSLRVTKAAVAHFDGERKNAVQVSVDLKCGESVKNTVKLWLELAAAQINKDSAEITGQASIAKPKGNTPNTAEYSIGAIVDQYGLPITFEPSKLTMKLYSDAACGNEVTNGPVTLSGKTITVTSGAVVNTKYYLKAYYNDQPCSDAKTITITNKQEGAPLTVVQGDITYGTAVNPSVSNKPKTAGAITYTYAGRDGTTYNSSDAPTNAGKYTVTATCEDANYIYTGSTQFQILPKEIKVDWIELTNDEYTYNGQQQTAKYTVKDKDINKLLEEGTDYTVEGDKQTNAGVHLLKIIGTGNYTSNFTAAAGAPSVNWNIRGLPVRINTATFQPRTYAKDNYSAVLDTLTLVTEDGSATPDTMTAGNGFTVSDIRVTNNNAGQQPVSFKVTLTNTNYKWKNETGNIFNVSESAGYKVTISKIDHRAEAVSAEGKYGSTVRVPLAEYLPDGWSVQQSAISVDSNGNGNVHKSFRLEDTTLVVELNNNEALVGKYVKITLPVASTNYNPFTITVTVTAQKKETQTVTANDLNVTYGDAGVKLNASALDNAKLTYQVTEGADVVAVDANGNVTLLKSGTAKIQITAAETDDYGTANTTVTVTVAKRSLTVKANDLTAYVGGQLPALDYTVTGLVSGDTLTTVPELELKDVPAGVDPMKTAGTYTIGFKTAPVADKDKYDLTVETGTLTVSSRPNVNPVPAGNSVKLEEAAGGKLTSSVSRATKGTTVTITVKPDAGYQLEELEVLDKNGEPLPLKELANGKFSFQMPNSKVTVQATFAQESTYVGYPDVLPGDWFYSAVRYVTERGLMNGTPNGFEPNMDSSRATIWTILARFSGVDTTVVSGEWYAVARQWAMENSVSDGTNPNGVITREQLATMLYRYAQSKGLVKAGAAADLSVFVDAEQVSIYALDAMRWAVSVGLLNGMDGNRLAPQGSAARAQVATMLMRFDQLAK